MGRFFAVVVGLETIAGAYYGYKTYVQGQRPIVVLTAPPGAGGYHPAPPNTDASGSSSSVRRGSAPVSPAAHISIPIQTPTRITLDREKCNSSGDQVICFQEAIQKAESDCASDDSEACREAGVLLRERGNLSVEDVQNNILQYLQISCAASNYKGCNNLCDFEVNQLHRPEVALGHCSTACDIGNIGESCHRAFNIINNGLGSSAELSPRERTNRALPFLEKACALNFEGSCWEKKSISDEIVRENLR